MSKILLVLVLVQRSTCILGSTRRALSYFFLFFLFSLWHDNQPGEAPRERLEKLELILVESCVRVGSAHGEVRHRWLTAGLLLLLLLLRDRERATHRAISRLDASI